MLAIKTMNNKYLNEPIFCYLTQEAEEEIEWLVDQYKMDRDLAMALLEISWPEERIYALEDEE